jgi:hypothetical protein
MRYDLTGDWGKLIIEELHNSGYAPNIMKGQGM